MPDRKTDDLWIESHVNLADHPKTLRAMRLLGVSKPAMIGHLHLLWYWGLRFATDGDLGRYDAGDIAAAALWEGDAERFCRVLIDVGFIDELPAGTILHDWLDYTRRLIEAREKNRERQRRFQERQRNGYGHSNNEGGNGDVTVTNDYLTVTAPLDNAVTNNQEPITKNNREDINNTPHAREEPAPASLSSHEQPQRPVRSVPKTKEPAERTIPGAMGIPIRVSPNGVNLADLMANDPPKKGRRGPAPPDDE